MSFDGDQNMTGLTSSEEGHNTFSWSKRVIEGVEKTTAVGCTTIHEKQLVIAGYLMRKRRDSTGG